MLKRKLGLYLKKNRKLKAIWSLLVNINLILFHWKEREKKISDGNEDPKTTYYVIRPRGTTEGLLSTYFYVLESCFYAYQNNYVPIVDFASVNCQYSPRRATHGT